MLKVVTRAGGGCSRGRGPRAKPRCGNGPLDSVNCHVHIHTRKAGGGPRIRLVTPTGHRPKRKRTRAGHQDQLEARKRPGSPAPSCLPPPASPSSTCCSWQPGDTTEVVFRFLSESASSGYVEPPRATPSVR